MTTLSSSPLSDTTTAQLSRWINRGLEGLWLLAVFLTPLVYLDQTYAISEASIGYVEVPKVALLRTLVALMAVLWLIEWGIRGRLPFEGLWRGQGLHLHPGDWLARLRGWLRDRPSRWLLLAAGFFLGTTLLSTILSGSRDVSLWGEVPGQDGYPAYTVAAYVLLFSVVATHLKTKAQLWRLMGALVTMGSLVSGYAIFQHYGHDFLDLIEQTGGGESEVSVFMGNSLFAGATMMMIIPMTLAAAVHSVGELRWTPEWSWRGFKPLVPSLVVVGLWSAVLTVQLLGITFTFARGPWVGMIAALAGFLGLVLLFAGWRVFRRAAVILGLTVAWGVAVLHGLGSISILDFGPWFGVIIALVGLLAVALVHVDWRVSGRVVQGVGLVVTLAVVIFLTFAWFGNDNRARGLESSLPISGAGEVAEQFSSIKGEVLGGFASGRGTHWRVSWRLFRDHPWPEFDSLSLPWLRHLIGYGPDLFRYTYLLESLPEGNDQLPTEPDNAHNFFIHFAVVQGVFGLFSSLGIFATVFMVGGYLLLRERQGYSLAHKLILIGLLATLAGRFLEMMVGVARVSDLTVLWVLLALFAALPQVMAMPEVVSEPVTPRLTGRRTRRRAEGLSSQTRHFNWKFIVRLAVVVWLTGGIFVLTWDKTVNHVRAAVETGAAAKNIKRGDFQAGLADLDQAIDLAPDVPVYYNYKAEVYLAYQRREDVRPEQECSTRENQGYRECLALQSYWSNLESVQRRPFYYRAHFALANSAYNLRGTELIITRSEDVPPTTIMLRDEAVRLYQETLALVPSSWLIRNELAEAHLAAGQPEAALKALEESLAITKDSTNSANAFWLQGLAYREVNEPEKAIRSLEWYQQLHGGGLTRGVPGILGELYGSLGQWESAAKALLDQGVAYQESGRLEESTELLERSADAYERSGRPQPAVEALFRVGLAYLALGKLEDSAEALERTLDLVEEGPSVQKTHRILAEIYGSLGQKELAAAHREAAQP